MHTRRIAANDGAMLLLLLRDVMKCIVVVGKKLVIVIVAQGFFRTTLTTYDVAADRGRWDVLQLRSDSCLLFEM